EPFAVGEQQHNGCDAPGHAKHCEQGFAEVMSHGAVGLNEDVPAEKCTMSAMASALRNHNYIWRVHYSLLSASTGSSNAALRAGYKPATIPAMDSELMARMAVDRTRRGVSKPGGCGSMPSNAIKPEATPIPMRPLSSVRNAPSTKN